AHVDHVDQSGAEEVILFLRTRTVLHGRIQTAEISIGFYEFLQFEARKISDLSPLFSYMAVVQAELGKQAHNPKSLRQNHQTGGHSTRRRTGGYAFHPAFPK
ncbi:MAG: hypothetical protein ACKVKF_23485, partial [Rhodobacterales bacterium]